MHKIIGTLLYLVCFSIQLSVAQNNTFDNWPGGKHPEEIGVAVTNKFLNTPHSLYGDTNPDKPPHQITYPDVCTWLGGFWFAHVTENKQLFNRL